jgi:outer membrane protein assembly factor BamB
VLASILLPPVGLALLWTRGGISTQKKLICSLLIAALGAGYLFLLLGSNINLFVRDPNAEAHYTELERHRAQQREQSAEAATIPVSGEAAAAASPVAQAPDGAASATTNSDEAKAGSKGSRNYWTNFRGPGRDGRYDELEILTAWPSEGPRKLWKQPVGGGYSSFVVAEATAFTIEKRRNQEVVAAYNVETGRELWTHAYNADFIQSEGDGPRATPTWDEGRLYTLGGTGELRCLDARSGKLIWSVNILRDNQAENLSWGMAASPLVVGDKVITLPGGTSGKSVVAYNKLTGQPAWKAHNDRQGYTSPMLVRLENKEQILAVSARRVMGLSVEDGALLWEYPWVNETGINVSQPIVVDNSRFFISAGYGKGAALVEVSRSGDRFAARKVWENISMKNKFNSSVLHNGHVYGLDEGILTCVDVNTGERKWKGGRYGYGQVLLASGHLIITTEEGELVLVKATPEQHTEVARVSALEGRTWNVPALAGGRLLVRNQTEMACYNLAAR